MLECKKCGVEIPDKDVKERARELGWCEPEHPRRPPIWVGGHVEQANDEAPEMRN